MVTEFAKRVILRFPLPEYQFAAVAKNPLLLDGNDLQ